MKHSTHFYFVGLFFFFLLIFNYSSKLTDSRSEGIKLCSKLNYKDSLKLHPNNFGKFDLTLNILDERKWRTIVFEDEINRVQNKQGNSSIYTNRRRADASVEINIKPNFKCIVLADIRPHGDLSDHRRGSGLPSLNVKLKDGHIFGIVHFILLRPNTRSYDNEIFVTTFLRELNLLAPRSSNVKVSYGSLKSDFIFQEKIVKEFLENSHLKESALFEGDQRFTWYDPPDTVNLSKHRLINKNWAKKGRSSHFISETGLSILNELNQYYRGEVIPIEIVDYYTTSKKLGMDNYFDKLPLFDSILYALEATHNLSRDDRHYYYDPTLRKFFPIYYDGMSQGIAALLTKDNKIIDLNIKDKKVTPSAVYGSTEALERLQILKINNLYKKLLKNGVELKKAQVKKLIEIIEDRLMLLKNFDENKIIKVSFDIKSRSFMKENFTSNNDVKRRFIYYDDKFQSYLNCNIYGDDCKKIILNTKNKIEALAQELKDENNNNMIFVGKKRKSPNNKGWFNHYAFQENFPENKIKQKTISKNVNLILYGNVDFEIDSSLKIITLNKNNSSSKIVFFGGTLDNWKIIFNDKSKKFENSASRLDINGFTGCVSFFDLKLVNISIESSNAQCEDAINFVRSRGSVKNLLVKDSKYDSVDADFSSIEFNLIDIKNSNNDCIDFSFGNYFLKEAKLKFCGDKGISVGETSKVIVENLFISNANIGIAAKDYGVVNISKGEIYSTKSCVEAYNKKQEFSGGSVISNELKCKNSHQNSWSDNGSLLKINFL